MAMSITFSSCSKGGDDDFLPNGGGTEVNGGSTQPLTEDEIGELNVAYNSANTTTFINALVSKGCIAKDDGTRSGDSDAKYVLTKKGKEYFKSDLFEVAKNEEKAYCFMCFVFQGIYSVKNDKNGYDIKEDMYGEYKWVSLDNPNVWLECSHKGDIYDEEFVIKYYKNNSLVNEHNFKDNRQIVNFDKIELSIRDDNHYYNYIRGLSNDDPFIFSQVRGSDDFYSSGGYYYTSSKDNICIANISIKNYYYPQGLYIRVPKTNK